MWGDRVRLIDHPMVQHKLSILRDKATPSKQFRELVRELALFEGYEAMRDLPLSEVDVETPLAPATCRRVAKQVAVVPILRAGLGMVDGVLDLVPAARVGHLGMYRDETTHRPVASYAKLPDDIAERVVIVVDPMLATGGSAAAAIAYLREQGVAGVVRLMVIVAAPQGVEAVLASDPDVEIYACAIDERLDENAYILPGLGDAGDRIFGTE